MQGTYCLEYKHLRTGETSAMNNFMKAGTAWKKPEEDDSESHK